MKKLFMIITILTIIASHSYAGDRDDSNELFSKSEEPIEVLLNSALAGVEVIVIRDLMKNKKRKIRLLSNVFFLDFAYRSTLILEGRNPGVSPLLTKGSDVVLNAGASVINSFNRDPKEKEDIEQNQYIQQRSNEIINE